MVSFVKVAMQFELIKQPLFVLQENKITIDFLLFFVILELSDRRRKTLFHWSLQRPKNCNTADLNSRLIL